MNYLLSAREFVALKVISTLVPLILVFLFGYVKKTGWKPVAFEVNAPATAKVTKVGIGRPRAAVSRRPLGWNECPVYPRCALYLQRQVRSGSIAVSCRSRLPVEGQEQTYVLASVPMDWYPSVDPRSEAGKIVYRLRT